VYIIREDGTGLTRVTQGPLKEQDPSWSPDGTRIAVTAMDTSGRTDIRIENVGGAKAVVLPSPPAGCSDREPSFSPDGLMIAFSRRCGVKPSSLFLMQANGTKPELLTTFGRTPKWSPDGSKIAYTGLGTYGPASFIMNADGTAKVKLTSDFSGDPVWSPDGNRILFTVRGISSLKLYVINLDGTGMRRLTEGPWDEATASWGWR
jgi:Tol biopolymer transport system component